jgi:hypothetical protein
MTDTAISPGVGSLVATGNAPGGIQGSVTQPTTGVIAAVGATPGMGFTLMPGVGSIEAQGQQPGGSMWSEPAVGTTVWTVLP